MVTIPQFFFVDSNSPFKDLPVLFPRGLNLAQKPWYLVSTVLKIRKRSNKNNCETSASNV